MAALSWMFRHSKMPREHLLVASVRVILRHHGLTSGNLVIDDTDNPRSKSARRSPICINCAIKKVAAISGGKAWFSRLGDPGNLPARGRGLLSARPELSAWYKTDKALKKQGVPAKQRPRKPPPNPQYPTKEQLALRLLETFKAHHPEVPIHAVMADALYGTATFARAPRPCSMVSK